MVFKILNKMGLNQSLIYFHIKGRKLSIKLEKYRSLCLPKPRTDHMKKALCMTEQNFGILFLKTSGKVNHFLPFAKKSPLT